MVQLPRFVLHLQDEEQKAEEQKDEQQKTNNVVND
jgi:hypothetical protein